MSDEKQDMSPDEYEAQMKKEHGLTEESSKTQEETPKNTPAQDNGSQDDKTDREKTEIKSESDQAGSRTKDSKNTTMAFLAYIFFVIPLLTDHKDDPFVKYHVKQSLGFLIACVAVSFFTMVPLIGWFFGPILVLVLFVFWILGVINALTGKEKPLPLIGQHSEKLNFNL